jgi:hypothetical protein
LECRTKHNFRRCKTKIPSTNLNWTQCSFCILISLHLAEIKWKDTDETISFVQFEILRWKIMFDCHTDL